MRHQRGNASVAGAGGLIGRDTSGTLGSEGGVGTIDESGNIGLSGLEEFEDMLMDREAFQANTVYFDFDKSEIHPDDRGKVEAVASHLTHCDFIACLVRRSRTQASHQRLG